MTIKKVWYTGWELKERWSISEPDLTHYILFEGLIAYPDVASDPYSKEDIESFVRGQQGYHFDFEATSGPWGLYYRADNVLEVEKKHSLKRTIDSSIDVKPKELCEPAEQTTTDKEMVEPGTKDQNEIIQKTLDDYIKSLIVYPVNNTEVTFKEPRGKTKPYHHHELNFTSTKNKGWIEFNKIIQHPQHIYQVSKAGGPYTAIRKIYDREMKLFYAINKKLTKFINDHLSPPTPIPESYKLYELCPEHEKGTYKFKFQIGDNKDDKDFFKSKCEKLPKNKLIKNLLGIWKDYSTKPDANYLNKKINTIKNVLMINHGMAENELKDLMSPSTSKEEIYNEFKEKQKRYQKDIDKDFQKSQKV